MKVPIIRVCATDADQAFAAHAAMLKAEVDEPALSRNPYWQALRDTAFARFRAAFQKG